jgi:hypothetical protein
MLAALGVLLAAAAVAAPSSTDMSRPRLQLRIEVEPDVTLDATDLRVIASEVRAIWAPVLDVAVTTGSASARLVAVDSIPLVITNRTLDSRENTGLGWISFVDGEPQPSITVSMAAAVRLMEGGRWRGVQFGELPRRASSMFLQRALGRAAAHEVGHYLLRTKNHSRRGLMRAVFTIDEIMDTRRSLDRLDPDDIAKLRNEQKIAKRQEE